MIININGTVTEGLIKWKTLMEEKFSESISQIVLSRIRKILGISCLRIDFFFAFKM